MPSLIYMTCVTESVLLKNLEKPVWKSSYSEASLSSRVQSSKLKNQNIRTMSNITAIFVTNYSRIDQIKFLWKTAFEKL